MTPTIRTADPRELLALVPYQLGFQPQESAVLVALRPPRGAVGLVARVDLADLTGPEGVGVARTLVDHLRADGADGVVLVLYTAQDLQLRPGPGERVVALIEQQAGAGGVDLHGCWVVSPRGYASLGCTDPVCCPPGGRPLTELQGARVGAEMVLLGASVAGSRSELAALPTVSPAARRSARRAAQRWQARHVAATEPTAAHRWRRESLELWLDALAGDAAQPAPGDEPEPAAATVTGRLAAGLTDVLVRDAVLVCLVDPDRRLAQRVVAGHGGAEVGALLRRVVDPDVGERPDPARAAPAARLLRDVAAHAPRTMIAPPLTLLGLLAWWEGDGARAGVMVERALDADDGHRLARLLDETIAVGMAPGWVRRRTA